MYSERNGDAFVSLPSPRLPPHSSDSERILCFLRNHFRDPFQPCNSMLLCFVAPVILSQESVWPADANKLQLLKTPGIHLIKWLLHSLELARLGPTPMLCFS